MFNKEIAEQLRKETIKKFEKRKAYSSYIDNIWGADLADMQFISKFQDLDPYMLLIFMINMHGLLL